MKTLEYNVQWNTGAQEKLLAFPDNVLYDTANSFKRASMWVTPMNTGALRTSANRYGVRKIDTHSYRLANTMWYSAATYKGYYLDALTREAFLIRHWTTPGTHGYWYRNTWFRSGKTLFKGALAKNIISLK